MIRTILMLSLGILNGVSAMEEPASKPLDTTDGTSLQNQQEEDSQIPGDYGDLKVFPKEILHEIIGFLGHGEGSLKNLKNLLLANKSFHQAMKSAPLHLDLSPYRFKITDDILAQIIDLFPNIVSLNLFGCTSITDEGLKHVKRLTRLTSLNLGSCQQITDDGLVHLRGLTQLTFLGLNSCQRITDTGIGHLNTLTNLRTLRLSGCSQITNAGLIHLKGFTHLTSLGLGGCPQIDDEGLKHLMELTEMTSLDLFGCSQITLEGKQSLKQALPRLTIYPKEKTKTAEQE